MLGTSTSMKLKYQLTWMQKKMKFVHSFFRICNFINFFGTPFLWTVTQQWQYCEWNLWHISQALPLPLKAVVPPCKVGAPVQIAKGSPELRAMSRSVPNLYNQQNNLIFPLALQTLQSPWKPLALPISRRVSLRRAVNLSFVSLPKAEAGPRCCCKPPCYSLHTCLWNPNLLAILLPEIRSSSSL